MKIAYLVQSVRPYDELIEFVNVLIKQGDHVFIMIDDNDVRDKVRFVYAEIQNVHISGTQEYGLEGDLSLPRGTIIQMKEALEIEPFDYFINLTDGMMPLKTRAEIISFLEENNGKDFYYVDREEDDALKKKSDKYYGLTNTYSFPKSKLTRSVSKGGAALLNLFGVKRKIEDAYRIGSPWFIISRKSAQILAENFSYVTEVFKLSWYPEEMYIPMMMKKFVYQGNNESTNHVNDDMRVVGPSGKWQESSGAKAITQEVINQYPDALFGGQICFEENEELYNTYINRYNKDNDDDNVEHRNSDFIDPETLMNMMNGEHKK